MNAQRLLRLAEHLETVVAELPPERFDMGVFARQARLDCGTECCALGHACSIPEFREAGLAIEWRTHSTNGRYGDVVFGEADGLGAAMGFFDISEDAAFDLFIPGDDESNATPIDVAKRIRHFVKMSQQWGVEYRPRNTAGRETAGRATLPG